MQASESLREEAISREKDLAEDFLRALLDVLDTLLYRTLPRNPELVYSLLHRQELIANLAAEPDWARALRNVQIVVALFNAAVDAAQRGGGGSGVSARASTDVATGANASSAGEGSGGQGAGSRQPTQSSAGGGGTGASDAAVAPDAQRRFLWGARSTGSDDGGIDALGSDALPPTRSTESDAAAESAMSRLHVRSSGSDHVATAHAAATWPHSRVQPHLGARGTSAGGSASGALAASQSPDTPAQLRASQRQSSVPSAAGNSGVATGATMTRSLGSGEWSVHRVMDVIQRALVTWKPNVLHRVPELQFTYEEAASARDFFLPYLWSLVAACPYTALTHGSVQSL